MDRINDEHARGQDQWIYNDFQKAVTEAKKTGKPIFVTFRCVPCKDCKAFDAEVAKGNKVIRELTEKHFISLRQVEMKNVNLSLFQFDYDLNWAAIFMNADGIIYSRYGTQSAAGADAYNSVESLEKTMRRVLPLHANASNYRKYLAGKRGEPKPY
ncbi:MAG: thioredoxin family protein, partial [Nitrospinaceae bacterium]|nr:thioredoxin family protein [Nitrospinaceae bacterium]